MKKGVCRRAHRPLGKLAESVKDLLTARGGRAKLLSVAAKLNVPASEVNASFLHLRKRGVRIKFDGTTLVLTSAVKPRQEDVCRPSDVVSCREFNQARDEEDRHVYGHDD